MDDLLLHNSKIVDPSVARGQSAKSRPAALMSLCPRTRCWKRSQWG